jgi:hypothetical protein
MADETPKVEPRRGDQLAWSDIDWDKMDAADAAGARERVAEAEERAETARKLAEALAHPEWSEYL